MLQVSPPQRDAPISQFLVRVALQLLLKRVQDNLDLMHLVKTQCSQDKVFKFLLALHLWQSVSDARTSLVMLGGQEEVLQFLSFPVEH